MNPTWTSGDLVGEKQYGVILADPPWDYDMSHRRGAASKHYPTMSLPELSTLSIANLAMPDCVLLLWGTWPKLNEACLPLIGAWGFHYVTGLPWIKLTEPPRFDLQGELNAHLAWGTGYWVRGVTEPLLIARRGSPALPDTNWAGILCERMEHSRKPASVYDYAESMRGPYLELFARRTRPGWDVWGNEVQSTVAL